MTDERPESLAAQAASWVPPWERTPRKPDPDYAAAHGAEDIDEDEDRDGDDSPSAEQAIPAESSASTDASDSNDASTSPASTSPVSTSPAPAELAASADIAVSATSSAAAGEDDDEQLSESGLSEDDDDFDPAFEGPNPSRSGSDVPPELPPWPGESGGPATVDAPRELPGEEEPDPTDVGGGPELPYPGAIQEASENEIGNSPLVDAPLPPDGDDAGDVFDHAADDDVTDDAEVDLPVTEEVPGPDTDADPDADESDEPDAEPAVQSTASAGRDAEPAADATDSPGDAPAKRAKPPRRAKSPVNDAAAGQDQPVAGDVPASAVPAQARRKGTGAVIGDAVIGDAVPRTDEGEVELKPLDEQELRAALESILLVVDEPVAEMQLAQIMEVSTERVARALEDLSARYTGAGSGIDLRRAAGGWRLYTRPEFAPYVERFVLDGQSVRLTQAALETLAVVAYKQPVTRSRISAIRGVNCDGVMRTLVTRGLIEECGTEGETGAFLYRTTALFLEKLGLNSVDQLPPLAPFLPDDVEEVLDASG